MVSFRNGAKVVAALALVNKVAADLPPIVAKVSPSLSNFLCLGVVSRRKADQSAE